MHRLRRKGGQTHGDVFGSFRSRRTISNPFPAMGHDRLPGLDMNGSSLGFHMQHPAEHQRIFVELRRLPRFHPPAGLCIRATLSCPVFELTRPMNSSMSLGLFPAASTLVGRSINLAISVHTPCQSQAPYGQKSCQSMRLTEYTRIRK